MKREPGAIVTEQPHPLIKHVYFDPAMLPYVMASHCTRCPGKVEEKKTCKGNEQTIFRIQPALVKGKCISNQTKIVKKFTCPVKPVVETVCTACQGIQKVYKFEARECKCSKLLVTTRKVKCCESSSIYPRPASMHTKTQGLEHDLFVLSLKLIKLERKLAL
ncbi:unnamed protein product [Protopolystoma xenopodis]|uniref:Uncharacterized protein n=1 Tax=Protopolystoma xenopodis TaxID=117903 RepID=A0A448WAP3_9PLAT|nr:unnamed protein product [Protopolystoma xenopodis]